MVLSVGLEEEGEGKGQRWASYLNGDVTQAELLQRPGQSVLLLSDGNSIACYDEIADVI